jgi:hypothetical protein
VVVLRHVATEAFIVKRGMKLALYNSIVDYSSVTPAHLAPLPVASLRKSVASS